jgi:23S rRNA (pseudouridine1915-N3)-methyltransferase
VGYRLQNLVFFSHTFVETKLMALRLTLISVRPSATHQTLQDDQVAEYLKRCGRDLPSAAKVFRTEKLLLAWVSAERGSGALDLWLADLGGKTLTSEQFAERLRAVRDSGTRHLILGIGPADGWSDEARKAAQLRFSLGAMTLPHELARLIVAEQIYRAVTILQGHPYHLGH